MNAKRLVIGCVISASAVIVFLYLLWPIHYMLTRSESWEKRKVRFESAANQAEPLLVAIHQFSAEKGHPPNSLADLIPNYIQSIPKTGLPDYPEFEFHRLTNAPAAIAWYDLGSRRGKKMTGLWVYPDGNADHSILVLTLDPSNRVVDLRTDRMPDSFIQKQFDAEMWRANSNRIQMVRALPQHCDIYGKPLQEIENLLGTPDGSRFLGESPWELRINCSSGMINWDVFIYWPTTNYPNYVHGGTTERIGDWAYVHE